MNKVYQIDRVVSISFKPEKSGLNIFLLQYGAGFQNT